MPRIFLCISVIFFFSFRSYSQCNNVNLAESRPQTSAFGSTSVGVLEPWRAFDGGSDEEYTRWSPNDTSQVNYVGIDLGAQYNICTIYLEMGSLDYATSLKIQGSNNMTTWTDLISLTGNTQNLLTIDNLPTTGTYRYIRALFLSRVYDWSYYNVYEFQIYNRVVNTPPNINLTAPATGASYIQGTGINFTSTASDLDGTISKVDYYQGTTLIGTSTSSPFSFTWNGAAIGSYSIEAKATDNGGTITWTDPVQINVVAAPTSLKNWNISGTNITNTNVGYVAIGGLPANLPSDTALKLSVKGNIYAQKLTVTQTGWSDYVFEKNYRLRPLNEVETFIRKNKHLPDVVSASQVEINGIDVGNNQSQLLKKIEELTLYLLKQNRLLQRQQHEIEKLKKMIKR